MAVEEGPDNLCRTRMIIQPERTFIRSNLRSATPIEGGTQAPKLLSD
jgi:hypothetical protein